MEATCVSKHAHVRIFALNSIHSPESASGLRFDSVQVQILPGIFENQTFYINLFSMQYQTKD